MLWFSVQVRAGQPIYMNYKIVEYRPGYYHIMKNNIPIHDNSTYGDDKTLIFKDIDIAYDALNELRDNIREDC